MVRGIDAGDDDASGGVDAASELDRDALADALPRAEQVEARDLQPLVSRVQDPVAREEEPDREAPRRRLTAIREGELPTEPAPSLLGAVLGEGGPGPREVRASHDHQIHAAGVGSSFSIARRVQEEVGSDVAW